MSLYKKLDISKYEKFDVWKNSIMDIFDDIIFSDLAKDVNAFYRRIRERINGKG